MNVEKTVFISYRRVDEPWAVAIYEKLTSFGFDVFIDIKGLGGGKFEKEILEHIASRAHFLLLLTKTALDRVGDPGDWLRREVEYAIECQRNVVPILLPGFDTPLAQLRSRFSGALETLPSYNGLVVPAGYLNEAIERLRSQFLDKAVNTRIEPMSTAAEAAAREQKMAATDAASKVQIATGPVETILAETRFGDRQDISALDVLKEWKSPYKLVYLAVGYVVQKALPNPTAAVAASLGILALGIVLRVIGLDLYFWLPSWSLLPQEVLNLPGMRQAAALDDTKFLRDCTAKARRGHQRYLIMSAAEHHKIEQDLAGERTIEQRISYTLLPFVDISPNDVGFDEQYSTTGKQRAWGGPFNETSDLPRPERSEYHVLVNAKRGVPLTIMTGINKRFGSDYIAPKFWQTSFGTNEDFYHYRNTEDEICSYLAVFDSDSLVLDPGRPVITSIGDGARSGDAVLQQKSRAVIDFEPYKFANSTFGISVSDFQPAHDVFVSWRMSARPNAASSGASSSSR